MAAVAAKESAAKSRRMRRKWEQNAAAGVPHGGSTRPSVLENVARAHEVQLHARREVLVGRPQ